MRSCQALPFEDTPAARRELAVFLGRAFGQADGAAGWERRFEHWWDLNPFAAQISERGWVLRSRDQGAVVGFLGVIPACYSVEGQPTAALVPTTWVVEPQHREGALMLGRRLREMEGRTLIVSTTGHQNFQARLVRRGWVLNTAAMRQFVPCGWAARWLLGQGGALHDGRRITGDVAQVRSIAQPFQRSQGIEKWLTPDYLRWYRHSPAREHRFAGVVDAQGELTSFLMLAAAPVMGLLKVWSVVDWFTTEPENEELRSLLATVAARPEEVGICQSAGSRPVLLKLTALTNDEVWSGVRGIWRSPVTLNHFHRAPEPWRLLPKRCVLAEGDLGL